MEYTTVTNNKDTNGILKLESDLLESKEREQSDITKMYKMKKNKSKINFLKKRKQRMLTHQKSHTKNQWKIWGLKRN